MSSRSKSKDQTSVAGESTRAAISGVDEVLHFHPWITRERFEETRRVWSKAYGHELSNDEVLDILLNVRRLAEAVIET